MSEITPPHPEFSVAMRRMIGSSELREHAYRDTVELFRSSVLAQMKRAGIDNQANGWLWYRQESGSFFTEKTVSPEVCVLIIEYHDSETGMVTTEPSIRVICAKRLTFDECIEEYFTVDLSVDARGRAKYVVGSYPATIVEGAQTDLETCVPMAVYRDDDNSLRLIDFPGEVAGDYLIGGDGQPFAIFSQIDRWEDRMTAIDRAVELTGQAFEYNPNFVGTRVGYDLESEIQD